MEESKIWGHTNRIATCGDESRITSSASTPVWARAAGHGGGGGGSLIDDLEWRKLIAHHSFPRFSKFASGPSCLTEETSGQDLVCHWATSPILIS